MSEKKIISRLLRRDFGSFARKAIRFLNGRKIPLDDLYLDVVFAYLLTIANGEELRLVINMPPRHLKTMAGIALAAWMMAHDPSKKIMIVCYGEDLAKRIAGYIRTLIKSDWYRNEFPATRVGDTDTGTLVTTTAGGYVFATSFTGAITGQGADLIIVDDPHKINDAAYPDQIARTVEIFNSTVESRLDSPSKGQILILAHRIARHDLSGTLLDEGEWTHLSLPLIAPRDLEFELDDNLVTLPKGGLLREGEFTPKRIKRLRTTSRNPSFEALYQQDPSEADDPLMAEHFKRFKKLPLLTGATLMSIDWAYTPSDLASYSVIQIWRPVDGNFCLIDQWRARVRYEDLVAKFRSMALRYVSSVILIENGALAEPLARELKGLFVRNFPRIELVQTGGRSKQARFKDVVDLIRQGRVSLPQSAEWVDGYIDEHISFPVFDYDDQVDATTQALKWFARGEPLPPPPERCMGVHINARLVRPPSGGFPGGGPGGPRVYVWARKR